MQPKDPLLEEQNESNKRYLKEKQADKFTQSFDVVGALEAATAALPAGHAWRQRGPHLVCTSCTHEHSQFIGINKILTSFDENGQPVLSERILREPTA